MAFMKLKPLTENIRFDKIVLEKDLPEEIVSFLDEGESIKYAYSSIRDYVIVTNLRIIIEDRKGIRGFRRSVYSVAYDFISVYWLDVNNFDCTINMVINSGHNLLLNFYKPIPLDNMFEVYKYISHKILEK